LFVGTHFARPVAVVRIVNEPERIGYGIKL